MKTGVTESCSVEVFQLIAICIISCISIKIAFFCLYNKLLSFIGLRRLRRIRCMLGFISEVRQWKNYNFFNSFLFEPYSQSPPLSTKAAENYLILYFDIHFSVWWFDGRLLIKINCNSMELCYSSIYHNQREKRRIIVAYCTGLLIQYSSIMCHFVSVHVVIARGIF